MTKEEVKNWVVKKAIVTNPYKKYWSASVTLGIDINGTGETIEFAYQNLTKLIFESKYYMELLAALPSPPKQEQ